MRPRQLIALGFALLLLGFALPFAMVIRILEPSFLLSFLAYGASVAGLLLGIISVAHYRNGRNP